MDFMEKITELRASKAQLLTQAEGLVADGKITEASAISDQMENINSQIAGLEKLAKASREAAEELIDRLPEIQQAQVDNRDYRALAQQYRGFLETHRCEDLVQLIKLVYAKNQHKSRSGKKPSKVDQDYQRRSESLLHGELAAALEIPVESVPDYIHQRLQLKLEAEKNAG